MNNIIKHFHHILQVIRQCLHCDVSHFMHCLSENVIVVCLLLTWWVSASSVARHRHSHFYELALSCSIVCIPISIRQAQTEDHSSPFVAVSVLTGQVSQSSSLAGLRDRPIMPTNNPGWSQLCRSVEINKNVKVSIPLYYVNIVCQVSISSCMNISRNVQWSETGMEDPQEDPCWCTASVCVAVN